MECETVPPGVAGDGMVVMIAEQMVGLSVKFHGVFNQNKSSFDKIPTGV